MVSTCPHLAPASLPLGCIFHCVFNHKPLSNPFFKQTDDVLTPRRFYLPHQKMDPGTSRSPVDAKSKNYPPQPIRSNLTLQILFFCNIFAVIAIFIIEVLIFIYKGLNLPYPKNTFTAEFVLLIALPVLEAVRLYFGMKGNLTRRIPALATSLAFAVPAILISVYFMIWQTYILRLEFILAILHVVFVSLEVIFSIVAIISFARSPEVFA